MTQRFAPAAYLYAVFILLPLYWLLIMSFKTNGEIMGALTFYPHAPNVANYALIFSDPDWYTGYLNAAKYVVLNVIISIVVALPAAYAFSRFEFAGKRQLFFTFLLFRMMAPAILLVPFVEIFSRLNLIDTHIAVALAHCYFNVPIAIWILEGFISAIPREVDELASVDGYALPHFAFKILLPQLAPGIAITAFFCFMFSWVEFLLSNALTTVHAKPIGSIMTRAAGVMTADIAMISTASILSLLPGVVVLVFVRKHLARGFSMGRVI
jgi:glycerol transport system permease protein